EPDFDELTARLHEIPPGSNGLLFIPHLDGRILPSNPAMRGAWVGLNRHHGRRHLVRAILESVAYEYANYLRVLLDLHPELQPDEARVIGGGARSAVWNHIKASVLGVPYVRLNRAEFSCWGAALVAGHAAGVFADLAEAAVETTAVAERYESDPAARTVYEQMTAHYQGLLEALATPSKALATLQSTEGEEAR